VDPLIKSGCIFYSYELALAPVVKTNGCLTLKDLS
ncbi:hypothetical protein VCHC37A1_1155B, partial [Vibrio cholerae HC-37A1]